MDVNNWSILYFDQHVFVISTSSITSQFQIRFLFKIIVITNRDSIFVLFLPTTPPSLTSDSLLI